MKGLISTGIAALFLMLPGALWGHMHEEGESGDRAGFSAELMHGAVWIGGKPSQEDAENADERIDSYERRADRESGVYPAVLISLRYVLADTGTTLFLNNRPEEEISLEAGIGAAMADMGNVTLSVGYMRKDVWEDPYLLGAEREKTLLQDVDMGIALEGAFGTGAQISYGLHVIDVGDDVAGERDRDLRRDGCSHSFGIGYQVPLHEGAMLIPQAAYEKGMFEGRSNRYSGCGLGLAYSVTAGQISARTSFEYGLKRYDHIHPVFNEKRKEDSRSASVFLYFMEPFGFRNTSIHLMGDYRVTDANIVFYDAREAMAGAGIGYRF